MLTGLKRMATVGLTAASLWMLPAVPVFAQGTAPPAINSGDTAWVLLSSALVMAMVVPGLAFFYGGLVSQRNALSTLMHSFFILALVAVQWVLMGYTLSFGPDIGGVIGGLDFLGFNGVGQEPNGSATIPHLAFAAFQGMFAAITVALITGGFAERMRFPAFILFSLLWTTLVYDPLAHWVWGGGWLAGLGALDFAGGTVVHISSGVSALVAALVIGKRYGYPESLRPPHNLPFTVLGAALLWFGWFGFNAGSALAANGLASLAFVVTHAATGAATLTWVAVEWTLKGKPTVLGAATGAIAGLVAITPAAGYVDVLSSLVIGVGAGLVGDWGVNWLKARLGADDALDVFGVHGLVGTWGALATGLFASEAVNPAGANGLLSGNPAQFVNQVIGVVAAWAMAAVGTYVILKVVGVVTPLRVSREEELVGLDQTLHGEEAYHLSPTVFGHASSAFGMDSAAAKAGNPADARPSS
ncbi:ammonia channel protein [Hydrogenibacillus schlegelii]|uniref:ammonium transporter n=1 Tax=Hydrogenibacillus schlegelii TaxID=1484 RepID=UPI000799AD3E|nr:ammonium transporter [Hydrogenibacillus schlegelii]KWX03295.1 ammonia channel protein [Hydrogenibacillus schlegelii]